MQISVETYLLQSRRRMERLLDKPGAQKLWQGVLAFLTGAALTGGGTPLAAAGIFRDGGWKSAARALGAGVGYGLLGIPMGLAWTAWALGLNLVLRLLDDGRIRPERAGVSLGCAVIFTGLLARLYVSEGYSAVRLLNQTLLAGGGAAAFASLSRKPESFWHLAEKAGVLFCLCNISPTSWINPGLIGAGIFSCGALPQAVLAGIGADFAGVSAMSVTAILAACCLLRQYLGPCSRLWAGLLPGLMGMVCLLLTRQWEWGNLASLTAGSVLGAVFTTPGVPARAPGSTGAAQVRLEQAARVMTRLRVLLLEAGENTADETALAERMRENACGSCTLRNGCTQREKLGLETLQDPLGFQCKRTGRVLQELRRSREQLRLMHSGRTRQQELRRALCWEYGFLSEYLSFLSDRLPGNAAGGSPRFRLGVTVRSRGKEIANGDKCTVFRGQGSVYYVALCDGMGTGLGAAQDSRELCTLLQALLSAGLPARYALREINTQLIFRGKSAASTLDLAEIRLDTGLVQLYKWGAAESLLVARGKVRPVGFGGPPPGLELEGTPEMPGRVALDKGQRLILISDGIEPENLSRLGALWEETPGVMAAWLVKNWGGDDDSTAVVIHLLPEPVAP